MVLKKCISHIVFSAFKTVYPSSYLLIFFWDLHVSCLPSIVFRLDKKVIWKYLKNEPQGLKEWLITKTSENLDVTFNIVNYIVLLKKQFLKQRSQFLLFSNYLSFDMACHTVISTQGTIWLETFTLAFSSATWR